ncbi:MAG: PH domain-containing protein [Phycisphaerales bacterium]|nr:PH domain-containing protein [Phycisphaerales bacterium]
MTGRTEQATQWIYRGLWAVLVRWFRVPTEPPTLPAGATGEVESFRPAEGFLRYMKFRFWIGLLLIDLAILVGWLVLLIAVWWLALLLAPIALIVAVVPDILAFVAIHLRYNTTWYVMSDRSMRLRRGVWTIHETTITFENVQNVKIQEGPLQRHYGIANLIVETAGGGISAGGKTLVTNQGIIEGIADAKRLRDQILVRLRLSQSAGLGDDDERGAGSIGWTDEHLAVLRDIRDEVAALPA